MRKLQNKGMQKHNSTWQTATPMAEAWSKTMSKQRFGAKKQRNKDTQLHNSI